MLRTITRKVGNFRIRNFVLAWHAGDIGTGAANPLPLDDSRPVTSLRQMPSQEFAANSAAKDENVHPLCLRHALSPYLYLLASF
jgi:hypothetical protein